MMRPDDPRHGTYAGTVTHYLEGPPTCGPCREAGATYRRNRRTRLYLARTNTLMVSSLGTIRRIQALAAIGHTLAEIDIELGYRKGRTSRLVSRGAPTIHRRVADKYAELFERWSMTPSRGPFANRTRIYAHKNGWAPPLAWDDIDSPDERPKGFELPEDRTIAFRHEVLAEIDERYGDLHDALRATGLKREGLRRWCWRTGHVDLYNRLADRAGRHPNGHMREAS